MTATGGVIAEDFSRILTIACALASERDLDRLLALIISEASHLVGADRTSLFLVDPVDGSLSSRVAQGSSLIRLPAGTGIAGEVAANRSVINIPQAYADPRFNSEQDARSGYRTTSILCLPLIDHDDKVVGVIQSLNRAAGPFTKRDETVLAALCAQAAVALSNARLLASERDRQRLERDLELARNIQQAASPRGPWTLCGWEMAGVCIPCEETGGDYLDVIPFADHVDAVVADVTGHGLPAAMIMMSARASLRALLSPEPSPSIATAIASLNRLMCADLNASTFLSMGLLRLFADGRLTSVSAGHEAPMLLLRDGQWTPLPAEGLLIGIDPDQEYQLAETTLSVGEMVVLLTDGVHEAQAAPTWQQLGMVAVEKAVRASAHGGAAAVVAALLQCVKEHLGPAQPHDDVTILVCRRTG